MQVQMEYRLPGIGAVVDDQPEGVFNAQLPRHFPCRQQQVPEQGLVGILRIGQSRNFLLGNHQYMGGRLGIDIPEGEAMCVFINNIGRNLSGNDPAK